MSALPNQNDFLFNTQNDVQHDNCNDEIQRISDRKHCPSCSCSINKVKTADFDSNRLTINNHINNNENVNDDIQGENNYRESSYTIEDNRLRSRLKYFLMSPCQKYRYKGVFQWKLLFQLLKIVLCTTQVIFLGVNLTSHYDFLKLSDISFKHLFLKDWESSLETMQYPPTTGSFSVYTYEDFFSSVNYVLQRYDENEDTALGAFQLFRNTSNNETIPIKMCNTHYGIGSIFSKNQSFIFNNKETTDCYNVGKLINETESSAIYDIEKYLRHINQSINFDRMIKIDLTFSLWTVHLRTKSKLDTPDCLQFDITITYDNSGHNGQVVISLATNAQDFICNGHVTYSNDDFVTVIGLTILDSIIVITSIMSSILCTRSIIKAMNLKHDTENYFRVRFKKKLTSSEKLEFFNLWYILMVITDMLTFTGSISKISIQYTPSKNYNLCCILLGTGNLFVWFGVLRYLGFFPKYNVLLITLKKSAPNCLRFLVCALSFFAGYAFCGWVVLGPFVLKFNTFSSTCECLFALINGDDIFATFANLTDPPYIFWFSRLYLYSFISLFTYIVLSVFISIVSDAFSTITDCYISPSENNNELHKFIYYQTDSTYFNDERGGFCNTLRCLFACCIRKMQKNKSDNAPLITVSE